MFFAHKHLIGVRINCGMHRPEIHTVSTGSLIRHAYYRRFKKQSIKQPLPLNLSRHRYLQTISIARKTAISIGQIKLVLPITAALMPFLPHPVLHFFPRKCTKRIYLYVACLFEFLKIIYAFFAKKASKQRAKEWIILA